MNLQEQIQHYKAVRHRIATSTKKTKTVEKKETDIYDWLSRPSTFKDPRMQIMEQCAKEYGCTVSDIFGRRKITNIMLARRKAAYLLVKRGRVSIADVGRYLNRDHTTILYAVKMYEKAFARGEGKSVQTPTAQMIETAGE